MKKTILNLGAIMIAFFIGVAINNACAGSIDNMSDSELRSLVSQLQKEVNSLKDRVAELENKIGGNSGRGNSSSTTSGEFEVNGIHFSRGGHHSDPVDYSDYGDCYQIQGDGQKISTISNTKTVYSYDSYGRIISQKTEYPTYTQETSYSYSNKTVKMTMSTQFLDQNSSVRESHTEQVIHLK